MDASDQFTKTLLQVGNDWDEIQNDPGFKKLGPDEQSDFRHSYFTNKVIGNPTIKQGLAGDGGFAAILHHQFFDQETADFDKKASFWNSDTPIPGTNWGMNWAQPTVQRITKALGVPDSDSIDPTEHPAYHALARFGEGLTTPAQLAIQVATAGLGPAVSGGSKLLGASPEIASTLASGASATASAGFSADMLLGAAKQVPDIGKALKASQDAALAGNSAAAKYYHSQAIEMAVNAGVGTAFGALAGKHAVSEFGDMAAPPVRPVDPMAALPEQFKPPTPEQEATPQAPAPKPIEYPRAPKPNPRGRTYEQLKASLNRSTPTPLEVAPEVEETVSQVSPPLPVDSHGEVVGAEPPATPLKTGSVQEALAKQPGDIEQYIWGKVKQKDLVISGAWTDEGLRKDFDIPQSASLRNLETADVIQRDKEGLWELSDRMTGAKPRNAADLMAASEMKETEYTPDQEAKDRAAFLGMTKKYAGNGSEVTPFLEVTGDNVQVKGPEAQIAEVVSPKPQPTASLGAKSASTSEAPKTPGEPVQRRAKVGDTVTISQGEHAGKTGQVVTASGNLARVRFKDGDANLPRDWAAKAGEAPKPRMPAPDNPERGSLSFKRTQEEDTAAKPGPIARLGQALQDVLKPSAEKQGTMNIIRRRTADLAQDKEQTMEALDSHIKRHDMDSTDDFRNFMDAGEGKPGAKPLAPKDQAIASTLHQMYNDRWPKLSKLIGREGQEGIADYLKHIWEGPQGQDISKRILMGKRPLEGPATFAKHRFYEYASDGLDAGLTPVTNNPIRMQLMGLFEIDRYLAAHDMKDDMKNAGTIKWVKLSGQAPEGWQQINDKIFKPRVYKNGGRVEYGNYYAPADAAKVFNNYLSPGLRGNWAYDVVRQYGNSLNQIQLGFSAFHFTFTSIDSAISEMGVAMQRFTKGDVVGAAGHGVRSLVPGMSAIHAYRLGKSMEQEYLTPGANPKLYNMVTALKLGGGRIGMDPFYDNAATENLKKIWSTNKFSPKLPFAGIKALTEKSSAWLMKYYVPRLKLGTFAVMAKGKLGDLIKDNPTLSTIQTEMAKTWDSVDNRMGQLTYDNLFWNKAVKDLGMLSTRSLGWTLGEGREFGGAGVDLVHQVGNILKGDRPELTHRMAYVMAMPVILGAYGAMYGYATGHPPQEPIDYFFPKTGGFGPDGKPERVSIPSYLRDVMSFRKHPLDTVGNKLHPAFQQLYDILNNHDFYNTEIRETGGPVLKQAAQIANFVRKSFVPFGVQGIMKRHEAGETWDKAAQGFFGIIPAPKAIGQSPAEQAAYEFSIRHQEAGPHTAGSFEQRQNFTKFRAQFQAGRVSEDQITQALKSGKITDNQVDSLYDKEQQSSLERHIFGLRAHPDELIRVWQKATPDEKVTMQETMYDAFDHINQDTQPELYSAYEKALAQ